jgi:molybdopterin-guanine dinucleotide biosynthesis protein A
MSSGPDEASDGALVGIVLAGGAARRFGADKLAILVEGRPLLERAVEAVAALGGPVVLSVGPASDAPSSHGSTPVHVVADPVAGGGPLVGLAAALDVASRLGAERAVVVGGDMPWLAPLVLRRLVDGLGGDPAATASTTLGACAPVVEGSLRPLPMALAVEPARRAAREALESGARSLLALVDRLPTVRLEEREWRALDPEGRTFVDVDRPEDLPRA